MLDFAEIWFQEQEEITFHDPLAAATIFDDTICTFERGQVAVELGSPETAGITHWTPDPAGPHLAALEVNPDAFFRQYFSFFEK